MKKLIAFLIFLFWLTPLIAQYFPSFDDTTDTHNNMGLYQYAFATDSLYYVVGSYDSIFFIKYDLSGNKIQMKYTSVNAGLDDVKYDQEVKILDDKFIVAAADYHSPYDGKVPMLAAFDFNFDTLWVWHFDSSYFPGIYQSIPTTFTDVEATPDGGYIVAGMHFQLSLNRNPTPFLMKLSATGAKQWLKYYQCPSTISNLKLTPDVGILFYSTLQGGRIIKTNALGDIQWQTDVSGRISLYEASDLIYSGGQTFALARAQNYVNTTNAYLMTFGLNLVKVNYLTGQILVDTFYKPLGNIADYGGGLQLHLLDNDVLMVSTTGYSSLDDSGFYSNFESTRRAGLAFYSPNGDSLTTITHIFGPKHHREVVLSGLALTPDGGFFGTGSLGIDGYGWCKAFGWSFKMGGSGYVAGILESLQDDRARVYPNPAVDHIMVVLNQPFNSRALFRLYNTTGELVKIMEVSAGETEFSINISILPQGIYFYQINTSGNSLMVRGKIIKVRE